MNSDVLEISQNHLRERECENAFAALPPDVRRWLCPAELRSAHHFGAPPRNLGHSPESRQDFAEGHSPSSHRAAEPRTRFHTSLGQRVGTGIYINWI